MTVNRFCGVPKMTKYTTRPLQPGVYVPLPTFFDENQEIDYDSYKKHLLGEFSLRTKMSLAMLNEMAFITAMTTRGMGKVIPRTLQNMH